jgi:hypothetical protein
MMHGCVTTRTDFRGLGFGDMTEERPHFDKQRLQIVQLTRITIKNIEPSHGDSGDLRAA